MGQVYNQLSKVTTDRASASLALARFLASEKFHNALPYLDFNRAFLFREEWDERHSDCMEDAKADLEYDPEDLDSKSAYESWLTRYEDDTKDMLDEVKKMKKRKMVEDLERFAQEWGIPFDAEFALTTALMTKGAHNAWNSSWCY